ncbi:MAG: hypothetical protein WC750_00665 [Patescibacteria group bacterium]|jgi:hypothetical protein
MSTYLEEAISKLPAQIPPAGMFEMINCAINREKKLRSIKRRAVAFASGLAILSGFMATFWNVLWQEIAQSSFAVYLQTALTDHNVLLTYWKEATMSLLESLPITNLIAWLLMAFFALGLLSMLWQIMKSEPHKHHHTALT